MAKPHIIIMNLVVSKVCYKFNSNNINCISCLLSCAFFLASSFSFSCFFFRNSSSSGPSNFTRLLICNKKQTLLLFLNIDTRCQCRWENLYLMNSNYATKYHKLQLKQQLTNILWNKCCKVDNKRVNFVHRKEGRGYFCEMFSNILNQLE